MRQAFVISIILQTILTLLASMILDGGIMFRLSLYAVIFYWGALSGVCLTRFVRPLPQSRIDTVLIKYGYLGLLALMPLLNAGVYLLKKHLSAL